MRVREMIDPYHYKGVVTSSQNRGPHQRMQDQKRLDVLPDRFRFSETLALWGCFQRDSEEFSGVPPRRKARKERRERLLGSKKEERVKSQYPKIRDIWKRKTKGFGKCFVCGEPAGFHAIVQTNYFRGDDDKVPVCEKHSKESAEVARVYAERKMA